MPCAVTFARTSWRRIPSLSRRAAAQSSRAPTRRGRRGDDRAMLASNESPFPPVEAVVEAVRAAAGGRQPLSRPGRAARCARALRPLRLPVSRGSRSETAPARSCSRRPRRCSSPGARSSTRGPRSRCIRTWPPPRTRTSVRGAARPTGTCTTSTRWRPRSPSGPGWCSSATPTTRPAPTCRATRSARSSSRCPPRVLVILDEAYIEFQTVEDPDTSLDLLRRFPNLVILRTFSKVYGLAGLRVGYALGSEEFRAAVDRVRQPFSVNHLAQAAATEALRHQDDVARRVEWNAVERLWMDEQLARAGPRRAPTARPTSAGSALRRPRRGRGGAGAASRAAWRCGPAAASAAPATCASPTARAPRTSASSRRCARSSRRLDSGRRRSRLDAFPATCYKVLPRHGAVEHSPSALAAARLAGPRWRAFFYSWRFS